MSAPPTRSPQSPTSSETVVAQVDNAPDPVSSEEETTSQTPASESPAPAPDLAEQIPNAEQSNDTAIGEEPSSEASRGRAASQPASRAASITEQTSPDSLANMPLPVAGHCTETEPIETQTVPDTSHTVEATEGEAPAILEIPAEEVTTQVEEQEEERIPKLFWLMIGGTGQPPRRGRFWHQAARRKAKGVISNDEGHEDKNSGAQGE